MPQILGALISENGGHCSCCDLDHEFTARWVVQFAVKSNNALESVHDYEIWEERAEDQEGPGVA